METLETPLDPPLCSRRLGLLEKAYIIVDTSLTNNYYVIVKECSICHTQMLLTPCRLTQPSWLVQTSQPDQLVYFVNEHCFFVMAFNLSQDEFVGKVCKK